jgi:hypothetical protein
MFTEHVPVQQSVALTHVAPSGRQPHWFTAQGAMQQSASLKHVMPWAAHPHAPSTHWFAQQVPGPTHSVPSGAHPGGAQWPPLHCALQHSDADEHVAPSGLQAAPLLEELLVVLELAVVLALDVLVDVPVVDVLALEVDGAPVLEPLARVVELVLVGAPPAPSPKWMPLLEHPPSSEAAPTSTIAKRCVPIVATFESIEEACDGEDQGRKPGLPMSAPPFHQATGCCAWRIGTRPPWSRCSLSSWRGRSGSRSGWRGTPSARSPCQRACRKPRTSWRRP